MKIFQRTLIAVAAAALSIGGFSGTISAAYATPQSTVIPGQERGQSLAPVSVHLNHHGKQLCQGTLVVAGWVYIDKSCLQQAEAQKINLHEATVKIGSSNPIAVKSVRSQNDSDLVWLELATPYQGPAFEPSVVSTHR